MRDDVFEQDCGAFSLCTCVLLMWLLYRTLLIEVHGEGRGNKGLLPSFPLFERGKKEKSANFLSFLYME